MEIKQREIKTIGDLVAWITAYEFYKEAKESNKKTILVRDIDNRIAEYFLLPLQEFMNTLGSIKIDG